MSLTDEPASEDAAHFLSISVIEEVPREQMMLQGHLARVIYHQVY